MSCLFKIKEALPTLSPTNQKIGEYVLSHIDEVMEKSAMELAQNSNTSSAAWVRFAKSVGYDGLTAMKLDLAKDSQDTDKNDLYNVVIKEKDSTKQLINKVQLLSLKTVNETYSLINVQHVQKAINILKQADTIYLVGVGASGIVCMDFMQKLVRLNKNVVYFEDTHLLFTKLSYISQNDAIIGISYSGTTSVVVEALTYAHQQNVPTIAITKYQSKTPIRKFADIILNLPVDEREIRLGAISSRNASLTITDLLYYGIAKENLKETKEDLIQTRQMISKIK